MDVRYSNHVWQCDHTKLDLMLVDQFGEVLSRPWLTKITDSYSLYNNGETSETRLTGWKGAIALTLITLTPN
ncbi:hypothetical protein [Floridanema aerugineum]|uniref:Uncharacterized protein n=1 Tax=Floridaenema aerugineum BLCC-F46 TaxID=3153654 RepID=A0ABV4X7R0_9CYAN